MCCPRCCTTCRLPVMTMAPFELPVPKPPDVMSEAMLSRIRNIVHEELTFLKAGIIAEMAHVDVKMSGTLRQNVEEMVKTAIDKAAYALSLQRRTGDVSIHKPRKTKRG